MSRIGELQRLIDKKAENVVQLLVGKGKKIACAESCTGGLISAAITSVSGSSAVMDMSICTYAVSAKEKFIGVPPKIVEKYGVVSAETASAMAEGVRKTAGSDIGVSVTGRTLARLVYTDPLLSGNENAREYIRKSTVLAALEWAEEEIQTEQEQQDNRA